MMATEVEDIIEAVAVEVEADPSDQRAVVQIYEPPSRGLVLNDEQRRLVYMDIARRGTEASPDEFEWFLQVCTLRGLNPFLKEAYLMKDRDGRINVLTGIDGFLKMAEESGQYQGITETTWMTDQQGHVIGAKVGVWRRGFREPMWGESWLEEDELDTPVWRKRRRTMLQKTALARALRRAFPRSMAGLYTTDELPEPGTGSSVPATDQSGRPQLPEVASESTPGHWRPPEPPPAPSEGYTGVVEKEPDGVRQTKSTRWEGVRPKIEVVLKVDGRRHTAIVTDELAYAVDSAALKVGDKINVVGTIEEVEWQVGKPKKKELWPVTAVSRLVGSTWEPLLYAMPLQTPENRRPLSSTSSGPNAPSPSSSRADASTSSDSSPIEPSDPAIQPPSTYPDASPPSSSGDLSEIVMTEGAVLDAHLRLMEQHDGTTASGRPFASLRLLDRHGVIHKAVLDAEEAKHQLRTEGGAWRYQPGTILRIIGTVRGEWIMLTAVTSEELEQ